jgi:hypothetical protein
MASLPRSQAVYRVASLPDPEVPSVDAPVEDETCLYRLIPWWSCDVIEGEWEFQSTAFDNSSPEAPGGAADDMSVVLGDTLAPLGRTPDTLPSTTPGRGSEWGVAVLQAGYLVHEEAQTLIREPTVSEPAHGEVRGKKNTARRRRLKRHATWVARPLRRPFEGHTG